MYPENKKKKTVFFRNLRKRYHLRLQDEISLKDRFSLKFSKLRIYLLAFLSISLLIGFTVYLLAFTGLRRFIPGYADRELGPKIYELERKTDSLEYLCSVQANYIQNIRSILTDNIDIESFTSDTQTAVHFSPEDVSYIPSREDSLLRQEFENVKDYTLLDRTIQAQPSSIASINFVIPILGGVLSNRFSRIDKHYGIDLVGKDDAPVVSTLDGTVIFSEWTMETGYVIAVQHHQDLVSIYKHNSLLLKQPGDCVKAGDPIAIMGNSGTLSTGQHLHFELWYKGSPINPEEYLIF